MIGIFMHRYFLISAAPLISDFFRKLTQKRLKQCSRSQAIIVYTSSHVHDYTTYMYNIQVFMHNFLILCILSNTLHTFTHFHSTF